MVHWWHLEEVGKVDTSSIEVPGHRLALLHTKVLDTTHTSANNILECIVKEVFESWLMDEASFVTRVTNSGDNIIKAVKNGGFENVYSIAHIIYLVMCGSLGIGEKSE